jgi:hypothetical protein
MKTKIYVINNKLSFTRYGELMIFPFSFKTNDESGTITIIGVISASEITFEVNSDDFIDQENNAIDSATLLNLLSTYCFSGFSYQTASSVIDLDSAKLIRSGQITSYITGDDGDSPRGREFYILAQNNPFGNINRFTDDTGGQTYTNDIIVDWSTYNGTTVLAYKKTPITGTSSWDDLITTINALSVAGFSNWRLFNVKEMMNIMDFSLQYVFDYLPFAIGEKYFYTSTTWEWDLNYAMFSYANQGYIQPTTKNQSFGGIAVRNFTLNELGL